MSTKTKELEDEEEEKEEIEDVDEVEESDEEMNDMFDAEEDVESLDDVGMADVDEDDILGDMTETGSSEEEKEEDGRTLEESINKGVSTLATYGIDDKETKEELREEYEDLAEGFDLGYHGDRFVEKYFNMSEGEIDPAVGLIGASIVFSVMAIEMRPDSDEIKESINEKIANINAGEKDDG